MPKIPRDFQLICDFMLNPSSSDKKQETRKLDHYITLTNDIPNISFRICFQFSLYLFIVLSLVADQICQKKIYLKLLLALNYHIINFMHSICSGLVTWITQLIFLIVNFKEYGGIFGCLNGRFSPMGKVVLLSTCLLKILSLLSILNF